MGALARTAVLNQYVFAEQKRKQIEEQYTYIADRLKELEEEKEDLKMYQTLDKQRRSLEYTLWDKEPSSPAPTLPLAPLPPHL